MDMNTKAIGQALTILKFLDAKFEIKLPDGQEFASETKRAKRSQNGPSLLHLYQEPIKSLPPGGYIELHVPEGQERDRFITNAQSYARHCYGDALITNRKETSIEILRTA